MMDKGLKTLLNDLEAYCKIQLVIKPKSGGLIPFEFNKAQKYIHQRLEAQKKKTGRVRAIILKGRQQGCSTYIAARYYHKTATNPDVLTFIFAHDSEASSSLYSMVKTYYDQSQDPTFRPELGASNAKELLFPNLRSGYKVGTAGTKGLGRSKTFQLIHWSEVAYSPNPDEHAAGILQTVPSADGTEIILESTAAGPGNYFHRACMKALADDAQSDYELIFVPWYWQDEYKEELPDDFALEQPTSDQTVTSEQEYYDIFKDDGLTLEHLAWRRKRIAGEFQGDTERFMREYPFTVQEAFEASAEESYIKPMLVKRARVTPPIQSDDAPLVFGVDPARHGGDAFCVHHRRGRNSTKHVRYPPLRLDQSATRLAQDIDKYKPMLVNIDAGGLGVGLYDMMISMGYSHIVNKVDFGGAALNPEINRNMTSEMFRRAREWLEDSPVSMSQLDEEDAERIQSQLCARRHEWHNNSVLRMESKELFRKEYTYSPDDADAFLLTFAKTIAPTTKGARIMQTYVPETTWSPFG